MNDVSLKAQTKQSINSFKRGEFNVAEKEAVPSEILVWKKLFLVLIEKGR